MNRDQFFELTDRISEGKASDADIELYNHYFNMFQELEQWDDNVLGSKLERGTSLYTQIDNAISSVPNVRKLSRFWVRTISAAAIFLVLGTITMFFLDKEQSLYHHEKNVSRINLSDKGTNDLIELPDGSSVLLSVGSKISFAPSFQRKKKREVYLVGKAFFDIKHLKGQPFLVHTGTLTTQVLGTAFDVDSKSNSLIVTVIRGKVVVHRPGKTLATLTPNKQIIYDYQTAIAHVNEINAQKSLSWRDKDLVFNDVTLQGVTLLLEERFGVKIKILDRSMAARKFTTTLFEHENLDDCLSLICDFNNAFYIYDKTNRIISIKPKTN